MTTERLIPGPLDPITAAMAEVHQAAGMSDADLSAAILDAQDLANLATGPTRHAARAVAILLEAALLDRKAENV